MSGTIDFVPARETITTSYAEGTTVDIEQFDGSVLRLHKSHEDWNPTDKKSVMDALKSAEAKGEIPTGLLYIDTQSKDLHHILNTHDTPLSKLNREDLCPGSRALAELNHEYR
jgi:2-oxoglutarate ferredoxin oxidoreductase subunit beta